MEAPSTPCPSRPTQRSKRPKLGDYVYLNFVSNHGIKDRSALPSFPVEQQQMNTTAAVRGVEEEPTGELGRGSEDQRDEDADGIWRCSNIRKRNDPNKHGGRSDEEVGAENNRSQHGDGHPNDLDGDRIHEPIIYPRTLGSSVSVLDEKDAVAKSAGARFAGEDPIRGRLRAADPFQWIGRLHAGAAAISGLHDNADIALRGLGAASVGGSSDGDDDRSASSEHCAMASREEGRVAGELLLQDGVSGAAERNVVGQVSEVDAIEEMGRAMEEYSESIDRRRFISGQVLNEVEEDEEEEEERNQEYKTSGEVSMPNKCEAEEQRYGWSRGFITCYTPEYMI